MDSLKRFYYNKLKGLTMRNKEIVMIFVLISFISGCASVRSGHGIKVIERPMSKFYPFETDIRIPKPTDYRIGIDDLIEVNIWKHPDLSKEVIVRQDGKISYLLIGDLQAAGLTVEELDDSMTKRFEGYAKELQKKQG